MRFAFTTVLLATLSCLSAQTKRALVVAIGNYSNWPKLSSKNDVGFITRALNKQDFKNEDIKIISDSGATAAGISGALTELVGASQKGDIVVIHFSSHGEQIEDDNGDETDGLDETIVTYNAVLPDDDGHYEDFKIAQLDYFRDDKLGQMIDELAETGPGRGCYCVHGSLSFRLRHPRGYPCAWRQASPGFINLQCQQIPRKKG